MTEEEHFELWERYQEVNDLAHEYGLDSLIHFIGVGACSLAALGSLREAGLEPGRNQKRFLAGGIALAATYIKDFRIDNEPSADDIVANFLGAEAAVRLDDYLEASDRDFRDYMEDLRDTANSSYEME